MTRRNIISFLLVSASMVFGQQSKPMPTLPTVASTQPVQVMSAVAYPGPVATAFVGNVAQIQFEAVLSDGRRIRNLQTVPVSVRWFPGPGIQPQVSCDLGSGICKVLSDKPGPVQVGVYSVDGAWGYFGGNVIINFLPAPHPFAALREAVLPITASTVQGNEREVVTVFVTIPRDFAGPHRMVVSTGRGESGKDFNFPQGLKAGQRVKIAEAEVMAYEQMGSNHISVTLFSNAGVTMGSGYSSYFTKSGYQSFAVEMDEQGNLKVVGNLPTEPIYRLILLRGDGCYLPLERVITYNNGDRLELAFYNGSNGFLVDLPIGYYSVGVIGEYPAGSLFSQIVPNALYLSKQVRLQ